MLPVEQSVEFVVEGLDLRFRRAAKESVSPCEIDGMAQHGYVRKLEQENEQGTVQSRSVSRSCAAPD